jgi:DnaK suppressor protein
MQKQIDLKDMQDRLRERKIVLDEQIEIENKKILPKRMDNQNVADHASDYAYRARQESRLNQLMGQLAEVDHALERIKDETYGICTNCGNVINSERLEALPYAELCIDCQRQEQ